MAESRALDVVMMVRGSNMPARDLDEEFSDEVIQKDYDGECASGFYLLRDKAMAEKYALDRCKKDSDVPYLHYYEVRLADLKRDVKTAYFTDLDERTIDYLSGNITGRLWDECKWERAVNTGMSPAEACHRCPVEECERSAAYIEAVLSYNVDFEFDGVLISYASGGMSAAEAIAAMNAMLREYNVPPVVQVTLRQGARPYIDYSHSVVIERG